MARFEENLDSCVKQILCGLSVAVREALRAVIASLVAQLQVQIASLEAYSLYLDILTAPVSLASASAQAFISTVKSAASVVPLNVIGSCVDMGDLNRAIAENLDVLLKDVNVITSDLNRLLSFKDEVDAAIADLEATIDLYNRVIDVINTCGV